MESTTLELGPRGLSVFDDYAKGSGNGQKHRKGIPGLLACFVMLNTVYLHSGVALQNIRLFSCIYIAYLLTVMDFLLL